MGAVLLPAHATLSSDSIVGNDAAFSEHAEELPDESGFVEVEDDGYDDGDHECDGNGEHANELEENDDDEYEEDDEIDEEDDVDEEEHDVDDDDDDIDVVSCLEVSSCCCLLWSTPSTMQTLSCRKRRKTSCETNWRSLIGEMAKM